LKINKGLIAQSWCNKNGIIIYPVTDLKAPKYNEGKKNIQKVQIEINNRGRINRDKTYYKQNEEVAQKIADYYIFYFDS
jgi:hypothetical protein